MFPDEWVLHSLDRDNLRLLAQNRNAHRGERLWRQGVSGSEYKNDINTQSEKRGLRT
ncbi:unnamed protein product [Ectocarpus sp. 6 AP-2014]